MRLYIATHLHKCLKISTKSRHCWIGYSHKDAVVIFQVLLDYIQQREELELAPHCFVGEKMLKLFRLAH